MSGDQTLRDIQALQTVDKSAAEERLLAFVRETFPQLTVEAVELRPSAVSLNSFNGFLTLRDGHKLFFKTHVEPDSIVGEYYNSQLLADAGYPIIRPVLASTEYGKQFLIYEKIESSSVFDLLAQMERGTATPDALALLEAQLAATDAHLWQIYRGSLSLQTAEEAARAPVHQLFYHRLAGKRCRDFYFEGEKPKIPLHKNWVINGRRYESTLADLIAAQALLDPMQSGASVIGHGDAHNGNVFLAEREFLYFDPAFAGRHNPFLDLAKPLFHNVFAHWMYFPLEAKQPQTLTVHEDAETIQITFDETLPPYRQLFFESKIERVLKPLVTELHARGWLRPDWRTYLKTALFCCPFLTMNLTDTNRFPAQVRWLGLSYAVIMGSESVGTTKSILDQMLSLINP